MTIINTMIKGGGGTQPTGTLAINTNGVHNVAQYENADVQVPTTAPTYYRQYNTIIDGTLTALQSDNQTSTFINLNGIGKLRTPYMFGYMYYNNNGLITANMSSIEEIDEFCCYNMFYNCTSLTSVDLSSLRKIGRSGCFGLCYNATGLNSVDLSNLEELSQSSLASAFGYSGLTSLDLSSLTTFANSGSCELMCQNCQNLTTVDLSSVVYVKPSVFKESFRNCTSLQSVDLSSFVGNQIGYNADQVCYSMFEGCTSLTSVNLSSLKYLNGMRCCYRMFYGCTSLQRIDLSALEEVYGSNAIDYMFSGCTALEFVDLSSFTGTIPATMFYGDNNLSELRLNPLLTRRNVSNGLAGLPLTVCPYENLEYQTASVTGTGICQNMKLQSVNMYAFELVNNANENMFKNNTTLTDIKFPVLTRWNGTNYAAGLLADCTNANFTDVYFPMLNVFRGAVPFTTTSFPSQLTVHFRKDQQTLIMSTSGASSAFGAAALVFDQIGTITVNGVNYIRQGKCNETGYYAWQKASSNITVNGTVYTFDMSQITRSTVPDVAGPMLYGWTNGSTIYLTDSLTPQVGDFIYPAFNEAQSTTLSISAVDNEFIYTVDSVEPDVGDTVYSDAQGTVLGTIDAVA